jgi:hypothetical protein
MRRDDPYPAPWTPEGQQNVSLFEGYDPTDALRKKAVCADPNSPVARLVSFELHMSHVAMPSRCV